MGQDGSGGEKIVENRVSRSVQRSEIIVDFESGLVDQVPAGIKKLKAVPVRPRTGDLEKLFATEGDVEQASGLQLLSIRLDTILPDSQQPRRTFPDDSLQELSDSIKQDGVIQPIEVTEISDGQYLIVHGERRWRAAQLAGLEVIPAVVRRRDYDRPTWLSGRRPDCG